MLPENTSIWTMLIALVAVFIVGALFSRLRRKSSDYTMLPGGATAKKRDKARRNALMLVERNLELMTGAVARYQAVLAELKADSAVAATALHKTYADVRSGLGRLEGALELLDSAVPELYGICFAVFNELSLQCRAAGMLAIIGGNDFGVGFEHMTAVYQMGGARSYQPAPQPALSEAELAVFRESVAHFAEARQELLRVLQREPGAAT